MLLMVYCADFGNSQLYLHTFARATAKIGLSSDFCLYIRLISGQVLLFIHHMEIMLNFELSQILELCLLGECPPQFSVVLLKVSVTFSFHLLSLF